MNDTRHISAEHPAYQLIHGEPAERTTATGSPRIKIIRLHGEEELAGLVEHEIQTNRPDLLQYVDYEDGNPKASALGVRSQNPELDDLNRSFNLTKEHPRYASPEREIADRLQTALQAYDYVLDLHTSDSECGRFFLAARPHHPAVEDIIACSPIDQIVVMPPHIAGPSLIGNVGRSISIEYNEVLAHTPEAISEIIQTIDGLIAGSPQHSQPRERYFYYVDDAVPKSEDPGDVHNFEFCEAGYYPVLFGEGPKSYRNDPSKTYLGFAATRREVVML